MHCSISCHPLCPPERVQLPQPTGTRPAPTVITIAKCSYVSPDMQDAEAAAIDGIVAGIPNQNQPPI